MGRSRSNDRYRSYSRSHSRSYSRSPSPDDENRIHVADLGMDPSRSELVRSFERFGRIVDMWLARNPPCFAFVVYRYRDEAERAIREMDGKALCGGRIRVSFARPRTRGHRRRGFDPNLRCYQCGEKGHFSRDCSEVWRNRRHDRSRSRSRSHGRQSRRRSRRSHSKSPSRSHSRSDSRSKSSKKKDSSNTKHSRNRVVSSSSPKSKSPKKTKSIEEKSEKKNSNEKTTESNDNKSDDDGNDTSPKRAVSESPCKSKSNTPVGETNGEVNSSTAHKPSETKDVDDDHWIALPDKGEGTWEEKSKCSAETYQLEGKWADSPPKGSVFPIDGRWADTPSPVNETDPGECAVGEGD